MAINTSSVVSNVYAQSYSASSTSTTKTTKQDEAAEVKKEEKVKDSQNLGKTIGEPKLSKEAQKYYDKLKKKFGNYDFILVSEDQKANAQANAGKYANNIKTVVSMNPIMIDGTGMCGGCRLTVGGETKFACVDGPDFDGHLVDFDEALERGAMYKEFETKKREETCNLFAKEVK